MTRFTFWAFSIPGLTHDISVYSDSFKHAEHKILKMIYLHKDGSLNKHIAIKDAKPIW
jgi:hypothetical protein